MTNRTSLVETDADDERVWATVLLDEKITDLVQKMTLEEKRAKFGSAPVIIITVDIRKMNGFIFEKVDRIYAKRG